VDRPRPSRPSHLILRSFRDDGRRARRFRCRHLPGGGRFTGIAARTAKRRLPSAAPGSTGLEYLVFSDDVRVAVVNHQWAVTPATWPTIDLVQYIGTVNPDSPLEKKIGDAADYARGAAGGRTTQFTLAEGSEGMACVAYDIKTAMHRLTGFICLPGTAPLSPADAKRLVDGIGIKGELAPG
jgi:hypothetical protein